MGVERIPDSLAKQSGFPWAVLFIGKPAQNFTSHPVENGITKNEQSDRANHFTGISSRLCYNPPVGVDITNTKIKYNNSFEDSKWLLVNIWTSIFLSAGGR